MTILVFNNLSKSSDQQSVVNIITNHTASPNSTNNQLLNRFNNENNDTLSVYYRLSSDARYHYEFRYKLHPSSKTNDHRVMLMLYGAKQECQDMWNSSAGIGTLATIHNSGYSILAICSQKKTYDIDVPIQKNNDIKYIYLSLQIWMNTVYYSRFKRYPLLYIHSTNLGSKFAGIICRVLPIQAQILYIHPGHREAMLIPSAYDSDMQTRLVLDPTFANWFYFDFCYNKTVKNMDNQTLCPFRSSHNYFFPLPPTFFTNLTSDPYQSEEIHKRFIMDIRTKAIRLEETLQLDILAPIKQNVSYIQENFPPWHSKPHAARLFFEHINNSTEYKTNDPKRQTCWCSEIDFKYFQQKPNVTLSWTKEKQNEYKNYLKDITAFEGIFCKLVCGDLLSTHSTISRNINRTLGWINRMNELRRSSYIKDYLKRPLRIWMYNKKSLIQRSKYFSSQEANWVNILQEFQMYSPEYYLQDYFQRLNGSGQIHRRHLQWVVNPLLADYFIIPSDLMFFYFHHKPAHLNDEEFKKVIVKLNDDYFETLLTSVRTNFPYWTLANQADQIGANHILPMPGGRNMGILFNKTQNILKNVIQLAFTGVRHDLLPPNARSPYVYRNIRIIYRHHYDVIIPQFTPLNMNRNKSDNLDILIKKKKRVFYFAGALSHTTSSTDARSRMSLLWRSINGNQKSTRTIQIQGRQFETMSIIAGHIKPDEYIKSIQSSVFSLCPEGYLPWSPRIYEAIQIGTIPILLVDNIVLPFERFINWRAISAKINVSNIQNIAGIVHRIDHFEQYIKRKLASALPFLHAFRWPYFVAREREKYKHTFEPKTDENGRAKNVFYYLIAELRCRRLEQWYGLTVDISTAQSKEAQRLACTNHPDICPCHQEERSLAFQEYI